MQLTFPTTPLSRSERCTSFAKQRGVAMIVRAFASIDAAIEQLDPFQWYMQPLRLPEKEVQQNRKTICIRRTT
jgi:hypothetical protein